MVEYIGGAPLQCVIRVTKGCDRTFVLRRKDIDDNPVDWDAEVYVDVAVNPKAAATRVEAVVDGSDATVTLEETLCDSVKNTTEWRALMSVPSGLTTLETPVAVGTFERHDGTAT